jgi:large subunit ribosomal protein L5
MEAAERDLTTITGQHPVQTEGQRSVAAFKLREGMKIGVMVTLRGRRMYDFMDKLTRTWRCPRLRDFRVSRRTRSTGAAATRSVSGATGLPGGRVTLD